MIALALVAIAAMVPASQLGPFGTDTANRPETTPSDQAYFVGSDGTVTPIDPAQTLPSPTYTPTTTAGPSGADYQGVPESAFLDTSVVGQFHEPDGRRDHNNWKICGAGALRILLAFVGKNPRWAVAYQTNPSSNATELVHIWPKMKYRDPNSNQYRQPQPFPGGSDPSGGAYMLFIAYSVHPPGWPATHIGTYTGKGENIGDMIDVANWEYAGEPKKLPHRPFIAGSAYSSFAAFDASVESQISLKHVPLVVSTMTGSYPPDGDGSRGLPNWKRWSCPKFSGPNKTGYCLAKYVPYYDVPDWTAIVGYDSTYYYYLHTCWTTMRCQRGAITNEVNYPGSTHPYTWRVDKATLYWEMSRLKDQGWLIYTGPPADRVTGW